MAASYMLSDRISGYEVKVTSANRKIVVRKTFSDYDVAMAFLDEMEAEYGRAYSVEFNTKFR